MGERGIVTVITTGYRDYATQVRLYNAYIAANKAHPYI